MRFLCGTAGMPPGGPFGIPLLTFQKERNTRSHDAH